MTATDHDFKIKNGARVSGEKLILGSSAYSADTNYVGLKTSAMTGSTEYMIISAPTDKHTYISAGSGKAVYIRGGGNNTSHQLVIDSTGAAFSGNLTVAGNLTVEGSQTVLETTTLSVEDKNITLNYGSGDTSGSANGAGITIQDAVNSSTNATILWDATNDKFDFSHPIQIESGTAASSPNIFRVLSALESNTNKGDVYAGIELGVNGAENSTGNIANGVVAAIKAVDFRNGSTSYEDSGLGFYTVGTSDSSTVFRGGFSNEGGLHISNDAVLDTVDQGNLQVDGITYANGGLYVSGVQILNTSGSVLAQTFDATDRDFVVTDTNESITNIIWKDDSEGKLYLGTPTFPAEFRSDVNLQTGLAFKMNGTTVVDSSRNAILEGLRASTTASASSTAGINFTATDSVSNQNFTAVRIDHNASGSQTHTTDNSHYALFVDQDSSASGGDTVNEHRLYGIYSDQRISASGDSDVMYSIYGYSESQHSSGTVSAVHGGFFIGKADDTGTGHTTNIYGVLGQAQADNSGSGGTSKLYGLYGKSILSTACDKNTNLATGVYAEIEIDDPGQAQTLSAAYVVRAEYDDDSAGNVTVSNGYMFYGNVAGTPATNMYGMYFADDLRHHFKGTLEARGADTDISTALAYGFASDRNTGMYSPANHVLGFATNGTERARLSGSDWLFHKQNSGLDGGGVEFASGGRARFTRDGANVIEINRKSSNGSLVTLYNGGSNLIGQINVINSLMALGTGAAGLIFNDDSDAIYPWNVAGGTGSDAALDLGISSRRWRDMHLGRTLYMNGGDIDLRNDTGGDNVTIRAVNFKTTGANGTDDRVAFISATTSGGTSTSRGGKLRLFTRDPNADSFNEIHVTNAGNLNIVDGGLQTAGTQRINNSGALTNISTATLSGAIYSNIAAGLTSMYLDTTTNASSGSVLYGPGIRWRQDDQTSIAGIRGAVAADGTNQLILGTGWLDQEMFIEPSRVRISGDLQVDGNDVKLAATNKRVKYSVWSNDTYGIGMHNTVTYGGLNNDYAMTFQMNNDVDRGWLFLDSDDTLAQGAMALTTEGKLTVADSIRLGYGKNDTTSPGLNSLDLEVSGTSKFDSQIRAGSGSETLPAFSFASDTNTGFYRAGENDLAVATGGDTRARFSNAAFQIEGGAGLRLKAGGRSDLAEGTYYNWFQTGAGTDTTTFYKICDVDIGTGLYKALAMHIRVKSQYGNYGSTEHVVFSEYTALFPRSGAVQDDAGTPRLSGYDTENHELRIYKTGTGEYELQARMKISYRDLIVELQVLSTNGGTVTMNESLSAGTTSGGTAYAATEHTANSAPEFYTGKLFAPSLGIGTTEPQGDIHIRRTGTATLVLEGDSNNSGDTGERDAEIFFLNDGGAGNDPFGTTAFGAHGFRVSTENYSGKTAFDISEWNNSGSGSYSSRIYIDQNGKVGINSNAPSSNLQLGSATADSDNFILFGKRVSSGESNLPFIGHDSHDGTTSDLGLGARSTSGRINFYTGNAASFTAANRKMVLTSGGRLGIGTDDPAVPLEVLAAGTTSTSIAYFSNSNDVQKAVIDLSSNGSGRLYLRDGANNTNIMLDSQGNSDSYINTGGNFGVGTDDPIAVLDVKIANDTVSNVLAGSYAAAFSSTTSGNTGHATGILLSGSSGSNRGAAIVAEAQSSGNDHDLIFATSAGSATPSEHMRIHSNGAIGIGYSGTPSGTVDIRETGANTAAIYLSDNTSWMRLVPNLGAGGYTGIAAAGDMGIIFSTDNDSTTHSTTNGLLIAPHNNNNQGLKILDNGNVGIGISSPAAKLHMYQGSAGTGVTDMLRIELNRSDHGATPSGPAILFKDQDTNNLTNEARIKMMTVNATDYGDNDEAASNLVFETTNGGTASDKMIITGRGDVGIGTVNPTQKLDVLGNIKAGGVSHPEFELVPTGSVGNADIRFNGTTFDIRSNSSSADLTLQTSTTERLRITAAGNVGIGEDDSASINDARLVIRDGNYASNQDGGIILQAGDATGNHWRAGFKIKSNSGGGPRTVIETMTGTAGGLVEALAFSSTNGDATFNSHITIPVNKGLYFGGGSHTYITEDIDDRLRFFTGGAEFMRFTESTTNTLSLYQPVSANNIACTALQATGLIEADRFLSGLGTVASPAYQVGDTDSGFYDSGANEIGVALGGALEYEFTTTQLNLNSNDLAGAKLIKMNTTDYLDFDDDSQAYTGGTNATVLASVSDVAIRTNTNDGGGGAFTVVSGSSSLTTMLSMTSSGNATFAGAISSGGLITATGASSGRFTGLEVVNSTNAGGTETAIGLGVVNSGNSSCDVKLVANRVGANAGSDFYIEQSDSSGNAQETFRISEAGAITSSGDISLDGKLSIEHDGSATGDLLSLFSNRFNGTTMYGWGVNNGTLYHKAATRHQFYTGTNYDNSSYDVQFDGQNFIIRTGDLKIGSNTFVDSSRNITSGAITSTGLLHLDRSTSTASSATGTTFVKIDNYVGSDLSQQKSFIDFIFQDDNANETPQVRIGAEVGHNGDANTQEKEGSGAFVVYTNNAESISGDAGASLAERFRVDYQGNITSGGVTTTLGDSGTNGVINMRASGNFYLQQNGATRLTLNSAGITSGSNVYTSVSGSFRNYSGTWNASTGLTGNGFTFVNSVDGTAMTISSTGDVVCTGSLSATTKSFDIEHPTKEGMRLHHGSLEGPEHGVYIRGRNKGTVIELPEYWLGLVDEDTITVQLTAIGEPQNLCVADIKDNKVYVKGVEYFYFIQAERKDIEKFEVEYAV